MAEDLEILAVFPLPNVVFFPGTRLPLHIFEPRYCEMVRETLSNKQHVGLFLLRPGWETDYYGNPPVFPIGCAGALEYVENLADDKYNIVLRGVHRVRAIEEIQENPYRKARAEILPEILDESPDALDAVRHTLQGAYSRISTESESLRDLSDFTEFVNTLATALQLDIDTKFQLLTQDNVFVRAQILQQILHRQVAALDWASRYGHLRPTDPTVN